MYTNVYPLDGSVKPFMLQTLLQTAAVLTGQRAAQADFHMNRPAHYILNMYIDNEIWNEILLWSIPFFIQRD